MSYEAVIGLECHVQLATTSKMFCGCPADYAGAAPNTHVCPICFGMPGVLPVMNRLAIEYTLLTGLALNAEIPEATKFDRKNYPYPDLVKGYQISQYDMPLVKGGSLEITVGDAPPRRIALERVHLEEDTGKLTHASGGSLVDYNRSGVPLMEMVSQPDLRSPAEERGVTVTQRTKEEAHDYRYFPEPDLPPLFVERAWLEELRARLPELPDARRARYMDAFGLSAYDAELLSTDHAAYELFEATVA